MKRQDTTTTYYKDIKNFLHVLKSRFTDDGLALYNENKNMHEHVKDFVLLNKKQQI